MTQELQDRLKDHFNRYKDTGEVFLSGDSFFLTEASALSYGNGKVERFTRKDISESKAEDTTIKKKKK